MSHHPSLLPRDQDGKEIDNKSSTPFRHLIYKQATLNLVPLTNNIYLFSETNAYAAQAGL